MVAPSIQNVPILFLIFSFFSLCLPFTSLSFSYLSILFFTFLLSSFFDSFLIASFFTFNFLFSLSLYFVSLLLPYSSPLASILFWLSFHLSPFIPGLLRTYSFLLHHGRSYRHTLDLSYQHLINGRLSTNNGSISSNRNPNAKRNKQPNASIKPRNRIF